MYEFVPSEPPSVWRWRRWGMKWILFCVRAFLFPRTGCDVCLDDTGGESPTWSVMLSRPRSREVLVLCSYRVREGGASKLVVAVNVKWPLECVLVVCLSRLLWAVRFPARS